MSFETIFIILTVLFLLTTVLVYFKYQKSLKVFNNLKQEYDVLYTRGCLLNQELEQERHKTLEKIELIQSLEKKLEQSFESIASRALSQNHESLMGVAKMTFEQLQSTTKTDMDHRHDAISKLVDPIAKALSNVDEKLLALEKERTIAYTDLKRQVADLLVTQKDLRHETASLVKALRSPHTRGQWGEMQLKRVVEMAGMVNHCDFYEQQSTDQKLRPDMVIRLPGEKTIVVDAKTSLSAYLNAVEATCEDQRQQFLTQHAQQVKTHIKQLSQKNYWDQFKSTPEFVVMFLPSEALFSAALEKEPDLIEFGVAERVILATPTTLISLLKAVSFGWRQESITETAQEISQLGKELYKRLSDMGASFSKMGRLLGQSVDAYNTTLGTLERRVFVTARKLKEVGGIVQDPIPAYELLNDQPRSLQSLELLETKGDTDNTDDLKNLALPV
jgi:DNA recombination protein RmuC